MDSKGLTICQNSIDLNELERDGKQIYQKNKFMCNFSNLMEHPEYKKMLRDHFASWDKIRMFMLFYKVYEKITKTFPYLNGYQKISMTKSLINTSKTRQLICTEIMESFKKNQAMITNTEE